MAKDIVYFTFALMAGVLAFVIFAEVCWWCFLRLFKLFDDYLHR
jgi:hypothetical protein